MVTYQTEPRRISHQLIRGAFPIRAMNRAILPVLWRMSRITLFDGRPVAKFDGLPGSTSRVL